MTHPRKMADVALGVVVILAMSTTNSTPGRTALRLRHLASQRPLGVELTSKKGN